MQRTGAVSQVIFECLTKLLSLRRTRGITSARGEREYYEINHRILLYVRIPDTLLVLAHTKRLVSEHSRNYISKANGLRKRHMLQKN